MPKDTARTLLPTSSTDFDLPPSTSSSSLLAPAYDDSTLIQRFRRPSLLAPKATHFTDSRLHSPLAASFTASSSHKRRANHSASSLDDSECLWSDISPPSSSENPTPPLISMDNTDERPRSTPLTPPRRSLSRGADLVDARSKARRLSFPLKPPRILNLLAESRPVENEVQSEAAFQRLLASGSELPRTPRTIADRGRYPEEAGPTDDFEREETPSDDEDDSNESGYTPYYPIPGSEPINIRTPAGSVNGDDINTMCISESPGQGSAMDVDVISGSPSMSSISSSISHWRSTPPPTTSAVRSNKRKFDERFDPYQNASKRRAVSPSLSYLRSESHPSSPKSRSNPRLPIAIPIMPASAVSSAASSPTVGVSAAAFLSMSRPTGSVSSPTMRASMSLGSPILRPVPRSAAGMRRGDGEEREIEGAGEAVGSLSLGS
ncbi:hypothetical protein C8J57DRAFT_1268124 [Mycena rebaudengoi]|nr:hypothetical protein C8J57DRAFT_1268124 [Mycena rebaudengoi]